MNRRQFLGLGAAVGTGTLAGCTFRETAESDRQQGPRVGLETVVEGLNFPTGIAFLPTGDRIVTERAGQIRRHTDGGLAPEPFLALEDRLEGTDGEMGLVGLALHPAFEQNRRLFVRYSGAPLSEEFSHTAVLSEFEVNPDLTRVVPGSERRILEVPEPGPVHNAGGIAFGPEGYLYVALGDGQRTNIGEDDQLWWYDQGQAAQRTDENLLGGILRIDVDRTEGDRNYAIPSDNPLVGEAGRDEYYAWGLRNPYRIAFDRDRLFIGDVGEHIRESVYLGEKGANYGWPLFEGSACGASTSVGHAVSDNPLNALNPKVWLAQTNRISSTKVCPNTSQIDAPVPDPVAEYSRPGSRAVTGGHVYRGDGIPGLAGSYVFGDYIPPAPLFALEVPGDDERPWPLTELVVEDTESGRLNDLVISFGRDPDGEMYVLSAQGGEGTGRVRRLTAPA